MWVHVRVSCGRDREEERRIEISRGTEWKGKRVGKGAALIDAPGNRR